MSGHLSVKRRRKPLLPVFLPFGHELGPALEPLTLQVLVKQVVRGSAGLAGRTLERHAGFFWGAATFAMVAGPTGGDEVVPGMSPAAVTREDVIQGEIARPNTAVLARVMVAHEDFACQYCGIRTRDLTLDHVRIPQYWHA